MSDISQRTNGDIVAPAVACARKAAGDLASWARDHPDEVTVAAVPALVLIIATARHPLSVFEQLLVAEAAYWAGRMAAREYRAWKARPARPVPGIRRVS